MCGIVGQIGPQSSSEDNLLRMMSMLTHRGPDEAGLLIGEGVGLGHLRLSIIDLKSGQQPMSSADGRIWITYNGEIFNYPELRDELQTRGHKFLNQSDTEVLIQAYSEWGVNCLERLNGQWAFALWDRRDQSFFLARDRWGVRPLYYTILPDGATLLFASEIKALLADDRVRRQWDYETLRDIFISWVGQPDRSPIKAIQQLPAGSYLRIRGGQRHVKKWWRLDYSPDVVEWQRTDASWKEETQFALSEACRVRLRSDVPVGAYLSGGLDSSIVTALTSSIHSNKLTTFSITFQDDDYDESSYQQLLINQLKTDHREIRVSRESIAEKFDQVIWHTETPIYRTAPGPMFALSRLVRDSGFRVVLTGEGADELFGGYDIFKENKIRRFWAGQPGSLWRKRLLERLESTIPGTNSRTRAFWYAFYQQYLQSIEEPGFSHHVRWANGAKLLQLINPEIMLRESLSDNRTSLHFDLSEWVEKQKTHVPTDFARWSSLSKAQFWESLQLLSGYLLSSQGDRMAMAHSVEGRYPFLDVNVYQLVRRMPAHIKLKALKEKWILKAAFASMLPGPIVQRVKNPYRAPDALALYHGGHRDLLANSLSEKATKRRGIFNAEAVSKLLSRVQRSSEPSALDNMAIVLVYSSHLFHDMFIEGSMRPLSLPPIKTRVDLGSGSSLTEIARNL